MEEEESSSLRSFPEEDRLDWVRIVRKRDEGHMDLELEETLRARRARARVSDMDLAMKMELKRYREKRGRRE